MLKLDTQSFAAAIIVTLWLIVALVVSAMPVQAQDNPLYVCRDPRYATIRLEFHNIPTLDYDYNYWAEGVGGYGDVLVADALTVDTDGYLAGTAGIIIGDKPLVGDAHSPLCDVALSPVQDSNYDYPIVLTPEPTQAPVVDSCPAWSNLNGTGKMICLWSLPRATG